MKSIKIFLVAIAAVAISSCNKGYLDPIPQTQLSDAVAFSTPERALQQILGLYSGVKSGQFLGGRYHIYNDVRGEEFYNQTANGVTALQTWNFTLTPTTNEVQNLWGAIYAAINRCNVVIKGLSTAPISAQLATEYIAEARFLRGFSYYALLTLYARPFWDGNGAKPGVPLRLDAETGAGSNLLARATAAEVYAQILTDLNFAEANLPLSYTLPYTKTTRAHRNTAVALKTRVYLSMGQYNNVITEANKIVSNSAPFQASSGANNRLEGVIASVFSTPYTSLENVFSMPFTSLDLAGGQNGLGSYYNPAPNGLGDYYLNPNAIIADVNWKATDARRAFNIVASGKTYLRKFPKSVGDISPDYTPLIRYSEIMLNLAEALVRQNNTVDARAVALLNAVRQRSDNTTTFAPATVTALLALIETERRIELLGEGFRSVDIMRLGQGFPAKDVAPAIPNNSTQYIWPIPLSERQLNTACDQNPGY